MNSGSLLGRLADRRLRAEACEQALIGFALIDSRLLRGIGQVPLSRAAGYVLDAITEDPAGARVALVAAVKIRVRLACALGESPPGRAAVKLACAAGALSVQALAQCGGPALVADLLRDARAPRNLRLVA